MKTPFNSFRASRRHGFTLVELLVVITIIALVATFAAPSLQGVLVGTNLNRTGQLIGDQINLAHLEATTRNRDVEVRFIQTKNATGDLQWRTVQVFALDDSGVYKALGKLINFPEGIVLSSTTALSPLVMDSTIIPSPEPTMTLPGNGATNFTYHPLRIRSNGTLESTVNVSPTPNNFLTVHNANDKANPPKNFYTLQVNPITGKVTVFRP